MTISWNRYVVLALGSLLAVSCAPLEVSDAPDTALRPAVDTYHDVQVTDSYRWLEIGMTMRFRPGVRGRILTRARFSTVFQRQNHFVLDSARYLEPTPALVISG